VAASWEANAFRRVYDEGYCPAKTPGSLGVNDRADPNASAYSGDTPGSLGINDFADPDPPLTPADRRRYTALLLDAGRLSAFLGSVAYLQVTAEMISLQKSSIGLWFSTTQANTPEEAATARLAAERKRLLTNQFADCCPRGSTALLEFLRTQERSRDAAKTKIQEAFAAANAANESTTRTLEHWVAGLKTTEYGAGIFLSVAGLFAAAAGAAVGLTYSIGTGAIDDLRQAGRSGADIVGLLFEHSGEELLKDKTKAALAGKELEEVKKLQAQVRHLHEKIAIKQSMISKTSSPRNAARLTRSISKNEAAISSDIKPIARFWGVSLLFVAWDVYENSEKIYKAWRPE
jgi:hypothetical protein